MLNRIISMLCVALMVIAAVSCSSTSNLYEGYTPPSMSPETLDEIDSPNPDPREGLGAGLFDAEDAAWNLNMISHVNPPEDFVGVTNSDLAFKGNYVIQGNYNGVVIWDISDPANPELVADYLCPASQSDVSVYGDLMFVSGEGLGGRLDCGTEGVKERASEERLRGIRIFDISDIKNPEYISNVQTCRGSHTHSVLKDPKDDENVYIYVSGSASVRPEEEMPGCVELLPEEDPNSALFRIEVIKVPLDNPTEAAIVNSPRIFDGLEEAPTHGLAEADKKKIQEAKDAGKFTANIRGTERVIPDRYAQRFLQMMVEKREGEGEPTAQDSAMLREEIDGIIANMFDDRTSGRGPNQCHDITLYPEIGLAGGACEGYGLLIDIEDPVNPKRIDAVADSNFSYWHSATFSNDGSKVLFTDEWGGGGQPKCRETDPLEWGANAIFTITDDKKLDFKSYYKITAAQTEQENCVAHNGSLIPVPGREIMVQSWYQGGISVFDWTDPSNPVEIAFHDRGPVDSTRMAMGGSWSVYWYNGAIYNSEIARGLDVFELTPNPWLTQNEIDAANTVQFDLLNAQGQPKITWPSTFSLARAYVDQLERHKAMSADAIANVRKDLFAAEKLEGGKRSKVLEDLALALENEKADAEGMVAEKIGALIKTIGDLKTVQMASR